ncbi:MAG: hypothetical protein Q9O74_12690 [Planctomycetota bacterium]|nr:hypothetical protein [Planctomycetota bacterium]
MTEKPSESTTTSTPAYGSSAPLPGEGTTGCAMLSLGVAAMLVTSVVVTVIAVMIVRAFGWV